MARETDALLLESVRVHRARLRAAFVHGELAARRTTNDNVRRFVASTVVAAVLCAGCAGWSFLRENVGSMRGSTAPSPTAPAATGASSTPGEATSEVTS
jgi:hypothetical protein